MRKLLFVFIVPIAAWSQPVTLGVKGGVPLGQPTADYGSLQVDSDHWTVGPTVEFHFPARLSLEIGALYSSYTVRYPSIPNPGTGFQIISTGETRAWDFPAALKFRLLSGPVRPFILGGVNYRRDNTDVRGSCVSPGSPCITTSYSTSQDRLGPVFGAGIEWKYGRVRLAPEFRYTRLNRPGANQYSLLFGISF
jgi:Outer membrane protein beta-barrel domain